MTQLRPVMFASPNLKLMPSQMLAHLKADEREVMRDADGWSRPEELSRVSAIDESLCLRAAIYERLPERLEKLKGLIPNYDHLKGELGENRVVCLIIRLFIHVRLRQYEYAAGL